MMAVENTTLGNYALTLSFLSVTVVSIAKQFFDSRAAQQRWERDREDRRRIHEWERDVRSDESQKTDAAQGNIKAAADLIRDHDVWERDTRAEVAAETVETRKMLGQAAEAAEKAYKEANHLNAKLVAMGIDWRHMRRRPAGKRSR